MRRSRSTDGGAHSIARAVRHRRGVRTRGAIVVAFVLLASLATTAVATSLRVVLPRDHAGHPSSEIEWWYVTGDVRGSDGARYSVFFTLFSGQGLVSPISQVMNLSSGALVGHTEVLAHRTPGTVSLDVRAPGHRLRYLPRSNTWRFVASKPDFTLDLTVTPTKPYVLHGGGSGLIQEGGAGRSSTTPRHGRARAAPSRLQGHASPLPAKPGSTTSGGTSADRANALNWDWFSCRFADRTELMLYRFRAQDGTPLARYSSGTLVSRAGRGTLVRSFDARPGARVLDAEGRQWPLDWMLTVPSAGLAVSLRALVDDQLVRGQVVPTFWEGASDVSGTKRGVCFVEETFP